MKIRQASPEEAARLTQVAHDAERHGGYPEHWLGHWQADFTISSDFIATNDVFVAEMEGEVIGFYALVMREDRAQLDHLCVAPAHLGTGIGKQLFFHAMQTAAGQSFSGVESSSDPLG